MILQIITGHNTFFPPPLRKVCTKEATLGKTMFYLSSSSCNQSLLFLQFSTKTAEADTSSELAKKSKETFRKEVSKRLQTTM